MEAADRERIEAIQRTVDEPYGYVTRRDIVFLLSQLSPAQGKCAGCGGPHPFDTSVPSVVWNAVIRRSGLADYLCATCILKAFVQAGQSFTAVLWSDEFNGLPIEVRIREQVALDAQSVQDENNTLRASLAACRAQGEARWRPIETAPEATYVLVFVPSYGINIATMTRDPNILGPNGNYWFIRGDNDRCHPTLWTPLPHLPRAALSSTPQIEKGD